MSNITTLSAETRKRTGSGVLKQMRREGWIPSVVYGTAGENQNIKINKKAFSDLIKASASTSLLVTLDVEGKEQLAFIQDMQINALSREIVHADFLAVDDKTIITADLPLVLVGEPKGVKLGGQLEQMVHSLKVKCFPQDLTAVIQADVSDLDVSESYPIGSIDFPKGVTPVLNDKVVVALVAKTRAAKSAGA
ncbi:50S ribosomal protein L25 [Persicirhabdus sediminis]|uniref:Large ribosomal subunit protein bL25 n=1 Tax=Persicirhabdus sediminis TaxID=454144 RepID=A0A8J7MIR7_9BACT|nr:50S ribosomal protein L25 [Persicirhabdus sediminis]MBK1792754.1 50S ribosomal protein L25 [Persicirhabdus sediminis]